MIIDKTLPEYSDVPHTLEGEILLERTYHSNGKLGGFLTVEIEHFAKMKALDPAGRAAEGWDKHATLLDAADINDLHAKRTAIQQRKTKGN